ncbi:MAG: hypothetical protein R6V40_02375 [Candidatus Moraniibacteriota bacterium]
MNHKKPTKEEVMKRCILVFIVVTASLFLLEISAEAKRNEANQERQFLCFQKECEKVYFFAEPLEVSKGLQELMQKEGWAMLEPENYTDKDKNILLSYKAKLDKKDTKELEVLVIFSKDSAVYFYSSEWRLKLPRML